MASQEEPSNPLAQRFGSLDEKLSAIHTELEAKIAGLGDDEQWQSYLDTMSRFHTYSLSNQLLIQIQRPGATTVAGFRKWKEMGRHVKKGERGISILAPRTVREQVQDAQGRPVLDEDGKPLKASKVVGFTSATVFDVSQTDGEDLPRPHREVTETPPEGFHGDLEAAVHDCGFEIRYEQKMAADGATVPGTKTVLIKEGLSPALRTATLAHELGHIRAGHLDRASEYHTGHEGQRGTMEVEAESIAYAVCRANGMSTRLGDASGTYIAGWSRVAGPEVVKESAHRISTVVKQILTSRPWRNMTEPAK